MRVLVACESSGIVREAFRARGHDAWSCDVKPAEDGGKHFECDALYILANSKPWDLLIAHPPCTYLSSSGLHWNHRVPGRAQLTEDAVQFALALWNAPVPRVALENPIGCLSSRIQGERQIIQPYDFGEDASKATVIFRRGLPALVGTQRIAGRIVNGKERWSNQTDSGQNRLGPSATRAAERSRTYPGIARAMADQWGA